MEAECAICCEKINKSNRKPVTCPHCSVETCLSCVKRYLLDLLGDPNCMHCRVGWNNDFMRSTFPSTWISKDYKEHREKVLFDIEKARMPDTQEFVHVTVRKAELAQEAADLHGKAQRLKAEYEAALAKHRDIQWKVTRIDRFLSGNGTNPLLEQNGNTRGLESQAEEAKEKKQFVMPCPLNDCRGFLSTGWKCGVCQSRICKDCHCKKEEDVEAEDSATGSSSSSKEEATETKPKPHVCDPTIKASVTLMKQDSKPCPSCGSMIFRIAGCDQMWCTQCNTAFSWNTGRIQTGQVHNPHYFQWLQQTGGDTGRARVLGCGQRFVDAYRRLGHNEPHKIVNAYRLVRHIVQVEIVQLEGNRRQNAMRNGGDPNRDIRINYMLNIMTEKEFKSLLQKREKDRAKKEQLRGIFTMVADVLDETLRSYFEERDPNRNYLEEMENIRKYANECFRSVSKQYQSQMACVIDEKFINTQWMKISSDEYKKIANIPQENTPVATATK